MQFASLRQFVLITRNENVTAVKVGICIARAQILRIVAVVEELLAALFVHGVRPRIRTGESEAPGGSFGHVELQCVVVGHTGGLVVLRVRIKANEGSSQVGVP